MLAVALRGHSHATGKVAILTPPYVSAFHTQTETPLFVCNFFAGDTPLHNTSLYLCAKYNLMKCSKR